MKWGPASIAGAIAAVVGFAACGGGGPAVSAGALRSYVAEVQPVRLGVNRLLEGADPILDAYRDHQMTGQQASDAMGRLEQRFAADTVRITALTPSNPALARLNAPYAHTYILEDSYLNALVAALPDGDFSALPNTQSDQRAAIILWRVRLEVLADQTHVHLPGNLQQAGRGEIAPDPGGGS